MLLLGILMVYLVGAGILVRISREFSLKELIAFSFLIGIAVETFFMFICDVIGFQFYTVVLFFASFAVIVACYDALYAYWLEKKKDIALPSFNLQRLNYPATVLLLIILTLFYIITQKNLFWPTTEYDAIGSYDKMGIVMALEGRIHVSLFQWGLQGSGGIYPPLFHGSLAYSYLFGGEQPKVMTTLYYISLLLGFYAIVKKYTTTFIALFFTLLLEMVPEMYSHAALLLSNMPTTAYVSGAALTLFVWLQSGERRYFLLSAILMGLCLWIRNDTVGFAIAGVLLVVLKLAKQKNWKDIAIYAITAFVTLLIWTLYLKFKVQITQDRFVDHFGFDTKKLETMILYVFSMVSWLQFGTMSPGILLYGLAFIFPLLIVLLNIKNWLTDKPYILAFIAVAFAIYFGIFYLIDETKQAAPISELMESSFKRGMFCFIPLLLFYAATSKPMLWFSLKIENFRTGN